MWKKRTRRVAEWGRLTLRPNHRTKGEEPPDATTLALALCLIILTLKVAYTQHGPTTVTVTSPCSSPSFPHFLCTQPYSDPRRSHLLPPFAWPQDRDEPLLKSFLGKLSFWKKADKGGGDLAGAGLGQDALTAGNLDKMGHVGGMEYTACCTAFVLPCP